MRSDLSRERSTPDPPTRTRQQEQRHGERRWRRSAATILVLVSLLSVAGLMSSCGSSEDSALKTRSDIESDSRSRNDDGVGNSDSGGGTQRQTKDPSEELGPVELVRVPDVVGLSDDEAFAWLESAGFSVETALKAIPIDEFPPRTVTGTDPIPGTLKPFGSLVVMNIYVDRAVVDPEMIAHLRISQQIESEFGDRFLWSHWDDTSAKLIVRIADLSADEADRLHTRYDDRPAVLAISASISFAQLQALRDSTLELLRGFFDECVAHPSSYGGGIHMRTWSVSVGFSVTEAEGHSLDECISDMKQAVLANAADFATEHSIPANPDDLVQFDRYSEEPCGDVLCD